MVGPFEIDRDAGLLLLDGAPVSLGRRAVGVLSLLLERPGAVVTKDELITRVWGGLAVEEGNLAAQIAAVRRALAAAAGEPGWIETLPRRGYRFTGPVRRFSAAPDGSEPLQALPGSAAPDLESFPCIAVLPFRTPAPTPVPGHVADGLADSMISALASIGGICVISLRSSVRLRLENLDLAAVGQALGARYVVSGAIRQAAGQLRVVSELAETLTGRVLVSRRMDVAAVALGEAQERVAAELARPLALRLNDEERARLRPKPPNDLTRPAWAMRDSLDPAAYDRPPIAYKPPGAGRALAAPG